MAQHDWVRPTTKAPPRAGLCWNGACWIDPPTGRVWQAAPDQAVLRAHLAELVALSEPTEFDRDAARLLASITR